MKPARGGREKVKELNSKEHQGLKSSGSECNKCEVACTEKGLWPMAWLCFFTLSTHTSGCFRQGNLFCLALLIFRGKGVGGGSRRLMRLCQMRHSRGAVGTRCFKQWFGGFDPHPCCPSNPPCPRGLGWSGGAWEQEGSAWNCRMLSSSTA